MTDTPEERAFLAAWKICSAWDGKITKPVLRKAIAAALKEIETGEVARFREALEFYADELTWADTNPKDDGRITVLVPSPSFAEIDRGERARAALRNEEQSDG